MYEKAIVLLEASLKINDCNLVRMALEELQPATNVVPSREPGTAPRKKVKGWRYPNHLKVGQSSLIRRMKSERRTKFKGKVDRWIIRMRAEGIFFKVEEVEKGFMATRVASAEESYRRAA